MQLRLDSIRFQQTVRPALSLITGPYISFESISLLNNSVQLLYGVFSFSNLFQARSSATVLALFYTENTKTCV